MASTKFKKQRELLLQDKARLEDELAQMHSEATVSEERREGSPFGKREEEATETLELEKRLGLENRMRQEIAAIDHTLDKIYRILGLFSEPAGSAFVVTAFMGLRRGEIQGSLWGKYHDDEM